MGFLLQLKDLPNLSINQINNCYNCIEKNYMTLQQLQYITALDHHRHFVKAAEACFVSQPTLTMGVKKLETEMGIKLFDRTKKPLSTTPAGQAIIAQARQILRGVNNLKAYVSEDYNKLEGEFRLAVIPTLAPYFIPIWLPVVAEILPKVRLNIRELTTPEIVDSFAREELDLALLSTPLVEKGLREIPLFHEPFHLYSSEVKNAEIVPMVKAGELNASELILLEEGHCFRDQMLALCGERTGEPRGSFSYLSGSIEAVKNLIKQSKGSTLVPELAINSQTDQEYVAPFRNPVPSREISLICHNTFTHELLLQKLEECARTAIPDHFETVTPRFRVEWK